MAKTDIGPKIGIEGEAEFRDKLNKINQGLKTLDAEAKAVAAAMQDETDAEKKSAAQKDVLERQIYTQTEKLKKLEEGLEASAKKYGEADTRTQKWQKAVYDATADLANMEHELKGLDGAVDEASGSMQDAEKSATGWADVMKGTICADTIKAGVKALAGVIKDVGSAMKDAATAGATYADTYNTMAATTGLSTDTLQEYAYMADLVDVSLETLTGAQTKLINSMRNAKDGTGAAAETWEALGVNIKNADGHLRSTEDVMNETLEALGKMENETERDAAAMSIFGRSAQELNPLIKAGADQLDALRKEAYDTGYVLSGSALNALNKQQDAMDRLDKRVEAVSNAFAAKLAPGVTRGAEALNEAFDNPRVQRGLDVISEGLGNVVSGAMDLAARALPALFEVFSFGDEKLRLYNDAQLEIVNRAGKVAEAHDELMGEYKSNAQTIVDETTRTKDLWEKLKKLADESGNVKKADHERAQVLLNELNEKLGTEYSLNGDLIAQYQEMQKEIDGLIKKQEAEALILASKEAFTTADKQKNQMLQAAADLVLQIEAASRAYEKASKDYAKAMEYADSHFDGTEEGETKRLRYLQKYIGAVNDTKATLDSLKEAYADYSDKAAQYYAEVDKWQQAQEAAARGDYNEVVRLLTDEFDATLNYYARKKELNEQEKKDLADKIREQERLIKEYKKNLEKGLTGFSESGLEELQSYVDEAKRILDGKSIGVNFVKGIEKGLKDKDALKGVEKAAYNVAYVVQNVTERTMQIKSPSRVGTWIGTMWDKGIAIGMERGEQELADVAEQLSRTIAAGSVPSSAMLHTGSYGNALAAPIGAYGGAASTSSYTTNMGGITIPIYGTGSATAEEIARQVEIKLTDVLNRAARGGRR